VPPLQPTSVLIAELPERLLPRIRGGFDILAGMSESERRSVVLKFLDSLERSSELEADWLDSVLTIGASDASALLTSVSVAVGILSQSSDGPADFLAAGRAELFSDGAAPAALDIASLITQQRTRIKQALTRRTLSAETLPSLESFDVSVDFRFRFDKENKIESGVPVAIVHIDTDVHPELYLQMSHSDIEMVIEKLNTTLKQMSVATKAFERSGSEK
jgi:hypothetical protein